MWGINLNIYQGMCLPPSLEVLWCAVECLLFQQINYLLVAQAICIVCTAILEILGAVNVFVTVTEKKKVIIVIDAAFVENLDYMEVMDVVVCS